MLVRKIFETTKPIHRLSVPARYVLATLIVAGFAILRWALRDLLDPVPFLLFFPAILIVALMIDHGSAIYASLVSILLSIFLFIPPHYSLAIEDPRLAFAALLTLLIMLLMAWLVENLREKTVSLARMEQEQRLLRAEMHHRIKNGLQLLTAILHLEAGREADARTRAMAKAVSNRIMVISRLHDRLYRSDLHDIVNAREFIEELCRELQMSLIEGRSIALQVRVQPVALALVQAVPVGLIVNELVTNALKHAFPADRSGTIAVDFTEADGFYVVTVGDDGVGGAGSSRPAGPKLVDLLTRQMGGRVETVGETGFVVRVRIPAGDRDARPAAV